MMKQIARKLLARFGRQHWQVRAHELLILMYHRVLPRDFDGLATVQPGMYVHPDTFEMQLRILKKMFEMVHLDDWLTIRGEGGVLPRRACVISLDDGWRDNFDYAFPILRAQNVPATIYVTSAIVGTRRHFFPERLTRILLHLHAGGEIGKIPWIAELVGREELPAVISSRSLDRIIEGAKRYPDRELNDQLLAAEQSLGLVTDYDPPDTLDWDQVRQMVGSGLVRLGSHTRNHLRMNGGQDSDQVRDEVVGSIDEIASHAAATAKTFCYPNGDISTQAESLVKQHYLAALTIDLGWNHAGTDAYKLRRVGMTEAYNTETAFLARLSGWI